MPDNNNKPYAVGVVSTAEVIERFATLDEAEAFLSDLPPEAVGKGFYFIDGPEDA